MLPLTRWYPARPEDSGYPLVALAGHGRVAVTRPAVARVAVFDTVGLRVVVVSSRQANTARRRRTTLDAMGEQSGAGT